MMGNEDGNGRDLGWGLGEVVSRWCRCRCGALLALYIAM